jgi:adenylate cyclase
VSDPTSRPRAAGSDTRVASWPRWLAWLAGHRLDRQGRRLRQAVLVGLAVAGFVLLIQRAGLFSSSQVGAADYLYSQDGDTGDDIVIVAIDEQSLRALGDWPLPIEPYVQLFDRLQGAGVVGFDVLLPSAGPGGDVSAAALVEAVGRLGNVVVPMAALELTPPQAEGELYAAGQTVRPFPALLEAAARSGSVNQALDYDGTVRRVPLLIRTAEGEIWEAFALQLVRLWLGLDAALPASLVGDQVIIGDETEAQYQIQADRNATMLVNFVGRPNTFPTYSLIDVIEDQVPTSTFEDRIVLVGLMNALTEMDLHRTPVSSQRMAGVEFVANAVHTLVNHRPLVRQDKRAVMVIVVVLALVSALSRLGAVLGALFTAILALLYFLFTSVWFSAGILPNAFCPYVTILLNYAAITATRFASERAERAQVTDVFGRFVSPEVRNTIVDLALEDPALIQPGGRQIRISVLFADIRGFTTISENVDPSDVVGILNRYLDSMEEEVFRQGGTLDKYTGDGMMVLFGAPLAQPDHAERAVKVALGMQHAAKQVSQQRGDIEWDFAYGIGITTGPAVVGHIGSKRRLDYTAIGDTVNLASRLEGVAAPGVILVDQATYEATKGIVRTEKLDPVEVKGKAHPVPIYKVLGMRKDGAHGSTEPHSD